MKYDTIRLMLRRSIIVIIDLKMIQFNVKIAFLYDDLEDYLYGTTSLEIDDCICLLRTSLYGLKQIKLRKEN